MRRAPLWLAGVLAAGGCDVSGHFEGVVHDGPGDTGCPSMCPDRPDDYWADVAATPPSTVTEGRAWLALDDAQQLDVRLHAEQLIQNNVANALILGFDDGSVSACPTLAEDTDGDGLVTLQEAAAASGGVLLDVGTAIPTDAEGTLDFEGTVGADDTCPIAHRVLVLTMSPFDAPPDTVVACGEIRLATAADLAAFDAP